MAIFDSWMFFHETIDLGEHSNYTFDDWHVFVFHCCKKEILRVITQVFDVDMCDIVSICTQWKLHSKIQDFIVFINLFERIHFFNRGIFNILWWVFIHIKDHLRINIHHVSLKSNPIRLSFLWVFLLPYFACVIIFFKILSKFSDPTTLFIIRVGIILLHEAIIVHALVKCLNVL